jgi:hypothetical protein
MYYFLVYDDGSHNNHLCCLLDSVKKYGSQFEIIKFNKNQIDNDFMIKNETILSQNRGGGYWLWKPYIINKVLNKINDDDVIFYLDSKYFFIEDFANLYLEYLTTNDLLVWNNKPNEPIWDMKNWCKMDVILKYHVYDKVFIENIKDCWAGAIVVKKTENTIRYMQEWLDMCCINEDITDSLSIVDNSDLFREHRHDQSLLNIVLQKYNIKTQFFEKKYLQNIRNRY